MDIKPVESYKNPEYNSYELKNGFKLAAGVAATAMLMGMLSGCSVVERLGEKITGGRVTPTNPPIEALDGDIAMPIYSPEDGADDLSSS